MNRVKRYLELWVKLMANNRLEIQRSVGMKTSSFIKSGASHDFDKLADNQELKDAITVDAIIDDEAYIGTLEKAAIYHFHLGTDYPKNAGEIAEVAYAWALDGLERGLNAKGLA